jgi:phage tail protein X
VPRRVTLPGADELFRSTAAATAAPDGVPAATTPPAERTPQPSRSGLTEAVPGDPQPAAAAGSRAPTRRQRHEEKITVYVSAAELVELEKARLTLRANHGLGVDRGRVVREALSVVLADLEAKGEDSILVRRLRST